MESNEQNTMVIDVKNYLRYLIAAGMALLALSLISVFPQIDDHSGIMLLLAAVVVSAWVCGWRAGLVATSLCAVGNVLVHLASGEDLMQESIRLTIFLSLCLLILTLAVLRQEAEDSLSHSETQLRAILDNSLDPIGVSRNGIHHFVNPAYLKMFGYTDSRDLIGHSVLKVIAPDERPSILRRLEARLNEQSSMEEYETRGLRQDGSSIDMEVHVSTYRLNGELMFLVILRDITERKRNLREKERLIDELRSALSKVKVLRGLLPTCASCKKIRDERGDWHEMENYICDHSEAGFSHGLCPHCAETLYPEVFAQKEETAARHG